MTDTPTGQAESQALLMQLLDPSNRPDPYPMYAQFRNRGPIQLPHLTVFSSYRHCDEVFHHPAASSDWLKSTIAQRQISAGIAPRPLGPREFIFLDPPDHTRLRGLVSKAFAPNVVNALQPEVVAQVEGLLDRIPSQGDFDVIAGLAYPLPVAVICRLLNVPIDDEPLFSRGIDAMAYGLDPFIAFTGAPSSGVEARMAAVGELRDYLRGLIERRHSRAGDDLISGLIAVEESGDQLSEEEIISTCNLLLIAGHDTTVNLIANAVLAMLRHPGQWTALSADASRAPALVEETLRYDAPVQLVARIATDDMIIGDTHIAKGDVMMLLLAAAHRDPDKFDRPDTFDPNRGPFRHFAFGRGPHFCLGAPLARLEANVALSAMTARFPHAALAGEPVYKPNLTLRGMSRLTVSV